MKLIAQYNDVSEASATASRLENKGIAVFISGRQSNSLARFSSGTLKVGLWVILESQYEDANELFHNRRHKVTSGISDQQISEIKSRVVSGTRSSILKSMLYIMLFLLGLISSYIYLF